eukprot:916861-Pleurochrysis_carterae.AAC.2
MAASTNALVSLPPAVPRAGQSGEVLAPGGVGLDGRLDPRETKGKIARRTPRAECLREAESDKNATHRRVRWREFVEPDGVSLRLGHLEQALSAYGHSLPVGCTRRTRDSRAGRIGRSCRSMSMHNSFTIGTQTISRLTFGCYGTG